MGTNAGRFFHTRDDFSNWGGLHTADLLRYVERFSAFLRCVRNWRLYLAVERGGLT